MSERPAAQRWSILANAIKSKHSKSVESGGSKRSFQSYNILKVSPLDEEEENTEECRWRLVSYKGASLAVRYLSPRLELSHLVGFNNTGNVCVWPSEESLAVYCLNNKHLFQVNIYQYLPCQEWPLGIGKFHTNSQKIKPEMFKRSI